MKLLGLFLMAILLGSCCCPPETPAARHYARCFELGRQIMYANAITDQQVGIQRRADLVRLHQAWIEERC